MFSSLLIFLLTIPWFPAIANDLADIQVLDAYEKRSRIVMVDGNMWIHAGRDKNVSFGTSGSGSIWFGNTDISKLPDLASFHDLRDKVQDNKRNFLIVLRRFLATSQSIRTLMDMTRNIHAAAQNISQDVTAMKEWKKHRTMKDVRMRRFLGRVSRALKTLLNTLNEDGCAKGPCKMGGTCIPRIGSKVFCLCPPHRTGEFCEFDLDECSLYEGAMACQNNATCTNIENGFLCNCPKGFHGPLCQFEHSSCRKSPGLCGRGTCIETADPDAESDYKCICDRGYEPSGDKSNPTCIDVNECAESPCHPGVDCINLPGTFQCSGCPKGYHGNGRQCVDIDECSLPNYPCSTDPKVECYNTVASYHCGSCPTGYRGDGKSCRKVSACTARPCHPLAECKDDLDSLNVGGFVCHCPSDYLGDGVGADGCQKGNSTVCRAEGRCMNGGTCRPVSDNSYRCICPEGYLGARCEKVSECISSPCKNGAECRYDLTNGYSCICPPGYYGQDCELEEDACGRHFTDRTGNFTYPDDFNADASPLCDIVIHPVGNNEVLRVTFLSFGGMENSEGGATDCKKTKGNLTLFDGDSDNSPMFATFCGEQSGPKAPLIDEPITMTGARALLRFRGSSGKFSLKWDLKKRECGYRTRSPTGVLVVPQHHLDTSCEWFISAPAEQHIELEIPTVEMSPVVNESCKTHSIQVFDGYTSYDAHRVVHICNTMNETTTVRSTGPFMSVAYLGTIIGGEKRPLEKGFEIRYKFVTPQLTCGGDIVNSNKDWNFAGEITSPNWGGFYHNDMDCTWKIDGAGNENSTTDQTLKLEFVEFDVPSPYVYVSPYTRFQFPIFPRNMMISRRTRPGILPDIYGSPLRGERKCTADYVHVYVDGVLQYDACNANEPPPSLILKEPKAIVQFHSDSTEQGMGFRMKYSMVCEKQLTGNGTIQTWNYPDGGPAGKCTYIINADPSAAIRIKFKTIGLSAPHMLCFFTKEIPDDVQDYVKLSGGRPENKQLNQKYVCKKYPFIENSEMIMSANRPFTMEFSSSGSSTNKGLLVEYSTVNIGCGGIFSASSGTISSPNYPEKYLPHMHCVYNIYVPWTKRVRLTFDNFDLEVVDDDTCSFDRVEVYDRYVSDEDHGELLGRFCGSMLPPSLLAHRYRMAVVFVSDRSVAGMGFSARFESVDVSQDCDRTFTSPTGTIYFNGTYGRFAQCDFHIALPHNSRIIMKVNELEMPCSKAKLMIRNGISEQSPGFPSLWSDSQICNEHPMPSKIRSHGNRMFLKLSASDSTNVVFNISYEQISSQCGGLVSGVSGSISSPQYPQKDSRPMECEWNVAVALGNRVRFSLSMVDDLNSSDDSGFCGVFASNRIDVVDGAHADSRLMRRYCKKVVGAEPVDSDDHEIVVRYKQHGGIHYGALYGFLAHFSTVCTDVVHTDLTGSIQSPGYPDAVYSNRYCSWTIQVPRGNRIQLTFHKFNMEKVNRWSRSAESCLENWISFGEGEVAQGTLMIGDQLNVTNNVDKLCNKKGIPRKIESVNNTLHIYFQSKQKELNHFWLTWNNLGCGGDLITPGKLEANLRYLNNLTDVYECFWKIVAPIGKKVKVSVEKLLIFKRNKDAPCNYEDDSYSGFEAYAGRSNISGVPQNSICEATKNGETVVTSHSNELFVRLKVHKYDLMHEESGIFFSANVTFEDTDPSDKDDCGGEVQVPASGSIAIHSPRFPEEYPRGTTCYWRFNAPPAHRIQFVLKEYLTPNAHPQKQQRWKPTGMENVTCQHPLPLIEGALTIFNGRNRSFQMAERVCLDITSPMTIDVEAQQSLVTFDGASATRVHMSGEDEQKKRVGFLLEASSKCGGLVFATSEEQVIQVADTDEGVCNITIRKQNPEDSGLMIRLDEIFLTSKTNSRRGVFSRVRTKNEVFITLDEGETVSRLLAHRVSLGTQHEEFRAETEIKIGIVIGADYWAPTISIAYSTELNACGADLVATNGVARIPSFDEDFECVWTLRNSHGNSVQIVLLPGFQLPDSPNCTDSYMEVRHFNESGDVVERFCDKGHHFVTRGESLWIKLRYVKPQPSEDADLEEIETVEPKMGFRFMHIPGGTVSPGVIATPLGTRTYSHVKWKLQGEADKGILVHFEDVRFPLPVPGSTQKSGLLFIEDSGQNAMASFFTRLRQQDDSDVIRGYNPPADLYLPYSSAYLFMFGFSTKSDMGFRLTWETVPLRDENTTETETEEYSYTCGGVLTPSLEWQEIKNEVPEGKTSGYAPDQHCKWTIVRPLFHGLEFRIVKLDLEEAPSCPYDYIALLADQQVERLDKRDELQFANRLCQKSKVNQTMNYSYNRVTFVHFVSDRSRGGSGFVLQYKLTCNSFDMIKASQGVFNHMLTSPGYANNNQLMDCSWSIILESNRRFSVTILDYDMEDSENCEKDFLSVDRRILRRIGQTRYCGKMDQSVEQKQVIQNGRLSVRYVDRGVPNKGFKMQISEVVEECSSEEMFVDEGTPSKIYQTPLYPKMLPNSLDCQYRMHAPPGKRIKFTVNPHHFRLESTEDDCMCDNCDWLELRDGPTEHSPLIGRYCSVYAPSTVYSTGNFLFMRLKTDSYAESNGFNATYEIASCGGTVVLRENVTSLLTSPNYPDIYGQKEECEWTVHAPNSHLIDMRINHLWLAWTINCTLDRLTVLNGDAQETDLLIPPVCNGRAIPQLDYRSSTSLATVQFVANTTVVRGGRQFCKDRKCGFELEMKVSEQGCGGVIDDLRGTLVAPGYPGRLLPHVKCVWELRAGIGYRYVLEFEFTDNTRNGYYQKRYKPSTVVQTNCFMDLHFFNGRPKYERTNFLNSKWFCENETTFLSESDLLTVVYSDFNVRMAKGMAESEEDMYYVPFRVNYTRVPAFVDDAGCTIEVKKNETHTIGEYNSSSQTHYCHLLVKRPDDYSTTVIKILNYTDERYSMPSGCSDWTSFIDIEDVDEYPRAIEERMCNATFMGKSETSRIYLNKEIEINVFTLITTLTSDAPQQSFTIAVEFQACGGVITEPNTGVVTSPNFGEGRKYLPNSNCQWMLKAPAGQVVQIKITDLDIEFDVECKRDLLVIGEGRDNSVIHRYCRQEHSNETSAELAMDERFANIRSHSQYLTFTWTTDGSDEFRGWRIEYEFVDVAQGCGFTTHAMSGVVHSPNFPGDYPNDQECLWDIQVPVGFHVNLRFTHFDIEATENCTNDALTISEEHTLSGIDPLGDYYFLFQDEDKSSPICGISLPKVFESSSNRIRLNFTSDERSNGKGFRAEWEARGGAVFQLSHYVITSPYYPSYYLNENSETKYLIDPTGENANSVVVLRMTDFDLSPIKVEMGRYPCDTDYVEIRDVLNNRVIYTYCGGEPVSEEPISVKGAVGIRFVTNTTFAFKERKHNRGFQISYSMRKCGDTVFLNGDNGWLTSVSSPAFPLSYQHGLDCLWNITTTADRVLSVRFENFDLEQSEGCVMDYLELTDGLDLNTTSMGKFCGGRELVPESRLRTKTNNLLAHFVSDATMNSGGFKIIVTATLGPAHGCGGYLRATQEWQTLAAPLRDDGTYHENLHCGWKVRAERENIIEFQLTSMDTEKLQRLPGDEKGPICVDELSIYDGYKNFSPLLASDLCSETVPTLPAYYHSSFRVAYVNFESDGSGSGKGFELKYRAKKRDCGENLIASELEQTYSYQSKMEKDAHTGQQTQRCTWQISAREQGPISLHLRSFNFPSKDGDCSDSYVEVRDVGLLSECQHPACAKQMHERKVMRFCGSTPIAPFISNTRVVQIKTSAVLSDQTPAGFTFAYQLLGNCNRTIDTTEIPSGRITSPNFPNSYDDNSTCITNFEAKPDKRIMIVFRSFSMERGRVQFFLPSNVNTSSLRYSQVLRRYGGRLRHSKSCEHDYFQIRENGQNATDAYCGIGLPPTFLSNSSKVQLIFKTDHSVTNDGYEATYYTLKSSFGQFLFFHTNYDHVGSLTNVEYPRTYSASSSQKWTLRPPPGHSCKFELQKLSLAVSVPGQDCLSMDEYLEINHSVRNAETEDDSEFSQRFRSCSHASPISFDIESGTNREVTVTFVTDDVIANNGQGFRLSWECDMYRTPLP